MTESNPMHPNSSTPLKTPTLTQTQRTNMILRQIRPWFVHDEAILNLLYFLPREEFFPDELKKFAFFDLEVQLAEGRLTHPPKLEGKILSHLELNQNKTVLEFGTLNGYLTAAMSKLANKVVSFEPNLELFEKAKERLKAFPNVEIHHASFNDWQNHPAIAGAHFDVVLINQPISHLLPAHLSLLHPTGSLFCFEGTKEYMRATLAQIKNGEVQKTPVFEFNLHSQIIQTTPKHFEF